MTASATNLRTLKAKLEAAVESYRSEFAGKDRKTRDLDRLGELLAEVRGVHRSLERRIGPMRRDERELFAEANKWLKLLSSEHAAVTEEKARPERTPEEKAIAEPGGRVNLYLSMLHARHHAAAERVDLALLYEVIEGLEACERDMVAVTPAKPEPWMRENLEGVRTSLMACRAQEDELAKSMASGGAGERRAFLVQLGADLEHFVAWEEKYIRRSAHRPARRRHAAATFAILAERLRAIGGLSGADADAMAAMVDRAERLLASAPEPSTTDDVDVTLKELGAELRSIGEVYKREFAGKLRASVSLPLLRRVLYRASSVAVLATDLWKRVPSEKTEAFRFRTRERAFIYEDEERAVAAQQPAPRTPKR